MKEFILFKLKTLNVIDEVKLIEYVDFCLKNNQNKKIIYQTSFHHILPKVIFKDFENLFENTWNGVHLFHSDHYIAHSLLAQAINEFSISKAFFGMHNKDIKLRNLPDEILVNSKIYNELKINHSHLMSEWQNEIMEDGRTRAQCNSDKQWETKRLTGNYGDASQMHTEEAIEKQKKTLNTIQESGLTRAQEIGQKGSETKRKNPEKYSGENNPFFGKKHSNETKQKMKKPKSNTENMKKTDETKQKISEKLKNRTFSNESKQKMKISWQNKEEICCPYCDKKSKNKGNMMRYHFDNCKLKILNEENLIF